MTLLAVVAAAIAGAILGVAAVLVLAAVAAVAFELAVPRKGGRVLGMAIMLAGAPLAAIAGALIAGSIAWSGGQLDHGVLFAPVIAVALYSEYNRLRRPPRVEVHVDPEGCTITPHLIHTSYSRHFILYRRFCPTTSSQTMNASTLRRWSPVDGPGNLLVVSMDQPVEGVEPGHVPISFQPFGSRRLEIVYDDRYRVVSRGASVRGVEISFRADPLFGR